MENSEHSEQQKANEEGYEIEITALEQSDTRKENPCSWFVPLLLKWQGPQYRRHWSLICLISLTLFLVALLSLSNVFSSSFLADLKGIFVPRLSTRSPSSLPAATLPPFPQQNGITCLQDTAWSPDSHFIAVLGYQQNCSHDRYVPALVNLYDARTSTLITQLHPDGAVLQALSTSLHSSLPRAFLSVPPSSPGTARLVFHYVHVIWSPDSQRLAFTLNTTVQAGSQSVSMNAIVLMGRDGAQPQVLLQQQNPTAPSYAEWDLVQKGAITSTSLPLPPAFAYHWGVNGTLIPERSLPPTLPATPSVPLSGPIGNPDGDHSFTIWQSALAHAIVFADASGVYSLYTWTTRFAAWSPDKRYIVDGLGLSALLAVPDRPFPSHKILQAFNLDQAPILPIRDSAMFEVMKRASISGIDTAIAITWRPDGRAMAAYRPTQVGLFQCSNGYQFTSFALRGKYAAPPADAVTLRWSPDGSHLLLSSVASGLELLWNVALQHT